MNTTVKVGDEVAFVWSTGAGDYIDVMTVTKVESSGFRCGNSTWVGHDWQMQNWRGPGRPTLICLATDEHREKVGHQRAVEELKAVQWETKSLATLNAVLYILSDEKGGKA